MTGTTPPEEGEQTQPMAAPPSLRKAPARDQGGRDLGGRAVSGPAAGGPAVDGLAAGAPGIVALPVGVWLSQHVSFTSAFIVIGAKRSGVSPITTL